MIALSRRAYVSGNSSTQAPLSFLSANMTISSFSRVIVSFMFALIGLHGHSAVASPSSRDGAFTKPFGAASNQLPARLQHVGIIPQLGKQIPLDAAFRDEKGRRITLGSLMGARPSVLVMVYFQCPLLCNQQLNNLMDTLARLSLRPGLDYDLIAVSIDPSETPEIAADELRMYRKRYGDNGGTAGWHFLVGDDLAISRLSESVGFFFTRVPGPDGALTQFAHATSLEVLTPNGRISQYFYGLSVRPRDLSFALIQASSGTIGSPLEKLLLFCYHYDPSSGRYSVTATRMVQVGGVLTVIGLLALAFFASAPRGFIRMRSSCRGRVLERTSLERPRR